MKKKKLKNLALNKSLITSLNSLKGGDYIWTTHCPGNTLDPGCGSIGACDDSYWCTASEIHPGEYSACAGQSCTNSCLRTVCDL